MKPENKQFIKYFGLVCAVYMLAQILLLLFLTVYSHSGFSGMKISEFITLLFTLFIFHGPVWIGLFLLADLVIKVRIPRKMTFVLEGLVFGFMLAPLVYTPSAEQYDYMEPVFYVIDFLLCLALLAKLRLRFVEKKAAEV